MSHRLPRFAPMTWMAAAIAIALALPMAAAPPEDAPDGTKQRGPHNPGAMLEHAREVLNLSDEQAEQIQIVMKRGHSEMAPQFDSVRDARAGLAELIHADGIDEIAIRDQAARLGAAEAELAVARAGMLGEVRALLDDEQAAGLEKMLQRREQHLGTAGAWHPGSGMRQRKGHGSHPSHAPHSHRSDNDNDNDDATSGDVDTP